MEDQLKERRNKLINLFKTNSSSIGYLLIFFIAWIGFYIRTRNLPLLQDKYLISPDDYLFLRYAKQILETGKIVSLDLMRNYPLGFDTSIESPILSKILVYLYKILHSFSSTITLEKADILYPPIMFIIAIIFFYLLIKKLFNFKVAILASAFLALIPTFLYRTTAGYGDKEPLEIALIFIALYFYVSGWHAKSIKKTLILGSIAGIFTGLTALTGGLVTSLFLIIGISALIEILIDKFDKKDLINFASWIFFTILITSVFYSSRYSLRGYFDSFTSMVMIFAFIVALINFLLFKKDVFKLKNKLDKINLPENFISLIITLILIIIITSIVIEPLYFFTKVHYMYDALTSPVTDRWLLTVAESHQTYVRDWFGELTPLFFWLIIISSIILFYEMIEPIKKNIWKLTVIYSLLLFSFIFSRYSSSSKIFNGTSSVSKIMVIGSILGFVLIFMYPYLRSYYKDKELLEKTKSINKRYIFTFIWFITMVVSAITAVRLLFLFSPIAALLGAYLFIKLIDLSSKIKEKSLRIITIIVIILILLNPITLGAFDSRGILVKFFSISYSQGRYSGPSYTQQWQIAMPWVQENTPENSVFAHWWDYGYYVQTGANRATITDGGNAIGYWNYMMGRHVLTGQNEEEALPFLKTHNATHLLIISDEIGKYPAFSSIGSDENYDRYSWINVFSLDPNNIQETRNKTIYFYSGVTALDEDIVIQDVLYPKGSAGIGGFLVPMKKQDSNVQIEQPELLLFYNNQRVNVPLECLYFNNQLLYFEKKGIPGCLMIIPVFQDQKSYNMIGAALYVSPRVARTLFAKLYLFSQDSDNFKLVYTDESNFPLAIFQGRIIGPLKIWEIKYPNNIKSDPKYLLTSYPDPNLARAR